VASITLKTPAALPFLALALAFGCSSGPPSETAQANRTPAGEPPAQQRPAPAPGANTLPIPGVDAVGQPLGAGRPSGRPLQWQMPANWAEEQPENNIRLAQYRVSGSAGDGECVVFYFGPGQGGDLESNAARWANQFSQPDGRPSTEVMKLEHFDGPSGHYHLIEVTGTFEGGMSNTERQTGYMLLGGATVRENREVFAGMMESAR